MTLKTMVRKSKILFIAILPVIGVAIYLFWGASTVRCPDDFTNFNEQSIAFDKWTKDFYDKNPNASIEDFAEARMDFLQNNNCDEALKRYNDYLSGNVDSNTKQMIEGVVSEYLNNSNRYDADELGFSFTYPDSLVVSVDPDSSARLIIFPKSLQGNENEPMTSIIISTGISNLDMTAEEWLKSPYSGYDISKGYSQRLVGGQDAVMTSGDWVVVKTPDNKRRVSIAYLVDTKSGGKPLREELKQILDTFSFKQ